MKNLFAFVFIIASVFTYAQETKQTKRFFIGANFSPDYCSRTLKNNDGSALSNTVVSAYKTIDRAKFGFSTGINACYVFTNHISVDVGIQYSNKGFLTSVFIFTSTSLPTSGKIVYTYNYMDIPLKANFVFGKKKIRFISSLGLTTNILFSTVGTFIEKNGNGQLVNNSSGSSINYKRIDLSPTVSCGIDYKVNDRMFFRIEPIFRYGILKMTDTPVTEYLWSAGLNISYYFGL